MSGIPGAPSSVIFIPGAPFTIDQLVPLRGTVVVSQQGAASMTIVPVDALEISIEPTGNPSVTVEPTP